MVIGTLAAIVYSLRYLVIMERRIAKMDENIQKITKKVLTEEMRIKRVESKIAAKVGATAKKRTTRRKKR